MQLLPLLAGVLLPGCWAVTGPRTVRGYVGGSVSVKCRYQAGQEMKPKFWCSPGTLYTCAADIIITSSLQPAVRRDRFFIWDNRAHQEFTVTMEGLARWDAGTYVCGVRTGTFEFDEHHFVKVIVAPAPSPIPPASPYTPPTEHPSVTSSIPVPTQTTPPGKVVVPGSNPLHHGDSSPPRLNMVEHILTPGIAVVLLLLAVAAGVLVILSRKRKKATSVLHPALSRAAVEMDRIHSTSHTEGDALNYAEINHRSGTAESQLYSNAEAFRCLTNTTTEYMEVKQSNQCLEKEKEATYASTQNSLPEQQEIYANVPSAPARRV